MRIIQVLYIFLWECQIPNFLSYLRESIYCMNIAYHSHCSLPYRLLVSSLTWISVAIKIMWITGNFSSLVFLFASCFKSSNLISPLYLVISSIMIGCSMESTILGLVLYPSWCKEPLVGYWNWLTFIFFEVTPSLPWKSCWGGDSFFIPLASSRFWYLDIC